jgi:hypothetical protein
MIYTRAFSILLDFHAFWAFNAQSVVVFNILKSSLPYLMCTRHYLDRRG